MYVEVFINRHLLEFIDEVENDSRYIDAPHLQRLVRKLTQLLEEFNDDCFESSSDED